MVVKKELYHGEVSKIRNTTSLCALLSKMQELGLGQKLGKKKYSDRKLSHELTKVTRVVFE